MKHFMRLQNRYFVMISDCRKTLELRLFDEKRRQIKHGDEIEFLNIDTGDRLLTVAENIITADTFDDLCSLIDIKQTGFSDKTILLREIKNIYPETKIRRYGAAAIKIKIVDNRNNS